MQLNSNLRQKMAETIHTTTMPAIATGALAGLPEDDLIKLYDEAVETKIAKSGEVAPEFPGGSYGDALHETYLKSGGLRFRK